MAERGYILGGLTSWSRVLTSWRGWDIYFRWADFAERGTDLMAGIRYILGGLTWQYRVLTLWRGGTIF